MNIKSNASLTTLGAAVLLLSFAAACGDNLGLPDARPARDGQLADDGDVLPNDAMVDAMADAMADATISSTPTVTANRPIDNTQNVALNATISATFSEAMNAATLTPSTFTLTVGTPAVTVPGTVIYGNSTATFRPTQRLASGSDFTARITVGAKSSYNVAVAAPHEWTFSTGIAVATEDIVDLGSAFNYVVLAKAGISTTANSTITGNLGVSPAAATSITGFALIPDSSNTFSTSTQVTGRVYAADHAVPTPANLTTAVDDMQIAFTDAASRAPDVTELGAGNIGGLNLVPGVYKWSTGVLVATNIRLIGSATDVWIFQIAQGLTMSSGARVMMLGGAVPKNVFWQAGGQITLNSAAHLEGSVLGQTAVTMGPGSTINGRLLAQTAVTLNNSTIAKPAP